MSPIDSPTGVDELTDRRPARSAAELAGRQKSLPPGHPSSPCYLPDGAGNAPEARHLTDREYAEHVAHVEGRLADAQVLSLASCLRHTIDNANEVWSDERDAAHLMIIEDVYGRAEDVPSDGKAILAGGLPGAGKTTILAEHAGIDLSQYLMLNPDLIKAELAVRGMIPAIDGLSPMEASDLVHEETSYIAKRLASKAQADGKNVIWDVTMSGTDKAIERIESLRASGYTRVEGIFVEIPIETSVRRASTRHREAHEEYLARHGPGGRHIPRPTILAHADAIWGSSNRRNFEQLKPRLDAWRIYGNALDGGAPALVTSHGADRDSASLARLREQRR